MKKIDVVLTKKQALEIESAKGSGDFALLAQPLLSCRVMKVLILTPEEFKMMDRAFKRLFKNPPPTKDGG